MPVHPEQRGKPSGLYLIHRTESIESRDKRGHGPHRDNFKGTSVTIFPPMVLAGSPLQGKQERSDLMGPDATPPESNAMAVKIFGTKMTG